MIDFISKFINICNSFPQSIAYKCVEDGRCLTYIELKNKIELWKGFFIQLGVKREQRVALQLSENVELIYAFYALSSIGAISVLCPSSASENEMKYLLDDSKAVCLVTDGTKNIKGYINKEDFFYLLVDSDSKDEPDREDIVLVSSLRSDPELLTGIDLDQIISFHYTYKGLGVPIRIQHTCYDYTKCVDHLIDIYPNNLDDVHISCLPMHAIYAISSSVILPLSRCNTILHSKNILKTGIINLMCEYKARVICLVPFLIKRLIREIETSEKVNIHDELNPDLTIISGGSYLDRKLQDAIYDLIGYEVFQGYGLTEYLPITFNSLQKNRRGSIGYVDKSYADIRIIDEKGEELPLGEVGEIAIKADCFCIESVPQFKNFNYNGFFATGDIGYIDCNGFLFFVGRKRKFSKIMSTMVDLVEIENVIKRLESVENAKVFIRESKQIGDTLCAAIKTKKEYEQPSIKDIKQICHQYLSRVKVPSKIVVI